MTKDEIIDSLLDQARDKELLANGDPDSIFMYDAEVLREVAKLLKEPFPEDRVREVEA